VVLMFFGTIAAFLPLVPGPALVWFAAMIYYLFGMGMRDVSIVAAIVLTIFMVLGSTTNIWMAGLGVKVTGGSGWGVFAGMVGMIVGLPFVFPIGSLVGAAVGTLLVEFQRNKNWRQTLKIGGGTVAGFILGAVVECVIALVMDGIFVVSLLLARQ